MANFVLGVDFGSDSVRCLVVDADSGNEVATAVRYYPRWREGLYCNPAENRYRQHPLDYIESLEGAVREALSAAGDEVVKAVRAISFDTTASTPALVDASGMPLALQSEYAENPDAMFVLWKDHTSIVEAERINEVAKRWHTDYTKYSGGIYSCEWVWAKMLHVLHNSPELQAKACSWVEMGDWIVALLTGVANHTGIVRGRCAAGHKAMWNEAWGGLPEVEFFDEIDPLLGTLRRDLSSYNTVVAGNSAGVMTDEWAERLGLPKGVVVGVSSVDCHTGAVGAGVGEGILVKVIGTSTCDIASTSYESIGDKTIRGICGQVDGSVLPNMVGIEAGQSAFGDIFAWFRRTMEWSLRHIAKADDSLFDKILPTLTAEAEQLPLSEGDIVAVDWFNGRRSPDDNPLATGVLSGLTLGTTAPQIFKALVEATAFGSRAITERLVEEGVKVEQIYAVGGISKKSRFVMQTLCDVLGMPIKVVCSEQACALGASMFAAVASAIYPTVAEAQQKMCSGFSEEYLPNVERKEIYDKLYARYLAIGRVQE